VEHSINSDFRPIRSIYRDDSLALSLLQQVDKNIILIFILDFWNVERQLSHDLLNRSRPVTSLNERGEPRRDLGNTSAAIKGLADRIEASISL
jgi:hypothetical protein